MDPVMQSRGGVEQIFPGRGNSTCKDTEAGNRLTYKELKKAHVLEACVRQWLYLRLEIRTGQGMLCL